MLCFIIEIKRKLCLDLVLVVLFINIDSLVCLVVNNNVGSKMIKMLFLFYINFCYEYLLCGK